MIPGFPNGQSTTQDRSWPMTDRRWPWSSSTFVSLHGTTAVCAGAQRQPPSCG